MRCERVNKPGTSQNKGHDGRRASRVASSEARNPNGGLPMMRRADGIDTPCSSTHVAINSLSTYNVPRNKLLGDLAAAGVPMSQVHVFLGDSGADSSRERYVHRGAWHYRVPHNSVDFSAFVHIVENPQYFGTVRQWFYLHDTVSIGGHFWSNVTKWCDGLPACALPLTRQAPSASMGLYDAAFINSRASDVLELKNSRGAPATRWKQRNINWEDKLFKLCDAHSADKPIRRFTRQCYNSTLKRRTCMCSRVEVDAEPLRAYGPESALRQVWRYACADVVKYKANWARNRTIVIGT